MAKYYKATFSNGFVLTRSSASERVYTHAWKSRGTFPAHETNHRGRVYQCNAGGWGGDGFSGSERLAHNAVNSYGKWGKSVVGNVVELDEVVPAIEITAQEYRALKKGGAA